MTNLINPQNNDGNNDEKNDVTIVGTDFFTDSESFLNELTDDELQQVTGGRQEEAVDGGFHFHSFLSIWC